MLQQAGLTNPALLPTILQGLQQQQQTSGSGSTTSSDAMHLAAAMMSAQSVSAACQLAACGAILVSHASECSVELHCSFLGIQPISTNSKSAYTHTHTHTHTTCSKQHTHTLTTCSKQHTHTHTHTLPVASSPPLTCKDHCVPLGAASLAGQNNLQLPVNLLSSALLNAASNNALTSMSQAPPTYLHRLLPFPSLSDQLAQLTGSSPLNTMVKSPGDPSQVPGEETGRKREVRLMKNR